MDKKKILVVDDEPSNVELLKLILKKEYDVMTAFDGGEALKKIDEQSPDLILLDIMMPGINGYDVCRNLKSNEKTMSIPIVMITALKENKDRINAIEAGADDFLSKPVDMDVLTAKLKSLLKVKQYYDNLMQKNRNTNISKNSIEFKNIEHPLLKEKTVAEDIVKNHLEIIILDMLYKKPMCGYDLIKEIFMKYNVLLSQGTVYPFLYSLKENGVLQAEYLKGDMRTKIYSTNLQGKQIIEKKLDDFITAEDYILNSIRRR